MSPLINFNHYHLDEEFFTIKYDKKYCLKKWFLEWTFHLLLGTVSRRYGFLQITKARKIFPSNDAKLSQEYCYDTLERDSGFSSIKNLAGYIF